MPYKPNKPTSNFEKAFYFPMIVQIANYRVQRNELENLVATLAGIPAAGFHLPGRGSVQRGKALGRKAPRGCEEAAGRLRRRASTLIGYGPRALGEEEAEGMARVREGRRSPRTVLGRGSGGGRRRLSPSLSLSGACRSSSLFPRGRASNRGG